MTHASIAADILERAHQIWPLTAVESGPDRWWLVGSGALAAHFPATWWRGLGDLDITINATPEVRNALLSKASGEPDWAGDFREWLITRPPRVGSSEEFSADILNGTAIRFRQVRLTPGVWRSTMHPRLSVPAKQAVIATPAGIAVLAPELVLLGKSRQVRPKDFNDFKTAVRLLEPPRRESLLAMLPASHPWRRQLSSDDSAAPTVPLG